MMRISPDRLMSELKRILVSQGVRIEEHVEVAEIIRCRTADMKGVRTARGEIAADGVVVATGA